MPYDQVLEDKVRNLCNRFDLSSAYGWAKGQNPSKNLPYHNWYHALCMVESCVEGANWHNLPYRSIRHLIVAALFHDFAHTGGKEKDSVNIQRALQGLYSLADRSPGRTVASDISMFEVEELIGVTEYPYELEPVCIEHKIIRDADLMQSFRPTWKEMIMDGLRQEMSVRTGKEISEQEMALAQMEFLNGVKPRSDWGYNVMIQQEQLITSYQNFRSLIK